MIDKDINFLQHGGEQPQIIANDPNLNHSEVPNNALAKLALLGVGIVGLCQMANIAFDYAHTCAVEDAFANLTGMFSPSGVQCVQEAGLWLPYMIRHLIK